MIKILKNHDNNSKVTKVSEAVEYLLRHGGQLSMRLKDFAQRANQLRDEVAFADRTIIHVPPKDPHMSMARSGDIHSYE